MGRGVFIILLFFCGVAQASEVHTQKTSQGWRLIVNGKPFFIKGMCYNPTSIGEVADDNTRRNWMDVDDDHDGRNDFAYQTWVDKNHNNRRDRGEKEVGDFALMQQMGVNAIRVYHHSSRDEELQELNLHTSKLFNGPAHKELLRDLHARFGIWVAMGDLLGAYTVSTGAQWHEGTDYTDPVQRVHMLKSVRDMVLTYKDEPYILMWILGNENNYERFTHTQAVHQPESYAKFINEAALMIKDLDPHHPVAIANGRYELMEYYARLAPAIDIFGMNYYSNNGFYEMWKKVAKTFDRPILLTEYGTSSPVFVGNKFVENSQVRVHKAAWQDIERHRAGGWGPGNAIGGFVFEWVDEWYHNGDPWHQNLSQDPARWNEEYNGMASLGDGSGGSLERQLRQVYGMYRAVWNAK